MLYDPDSLLGRLQTLPDPRRRQGRRYPLPALLGLLILAALHGESSLRGMWVWAKNHWQDVWRPLGFGSPHFPALSTIWNILGTLDADAVDNVVSAWLNELLGQTVGGLSADGKVLRGSRRADLPGVWLVALARQDVGSVMRQRLVAPGSHELPTLLTLLRDTPLQDHTITRDAGLLCADTTQVIRAQQGDYLGVVKGKHAEIKAAVDDWIAEQVFFPAAGAARRADDREVAGTTRDACVVDRANARPRALSCGRVGLAGSAASWLGPAPPPGPAQSTVDGSMGHRGDQFSTCRCNSCGHPALGAPALGD